MKINGKPVVVVSRHNATIEFIARELGGIVDGDRIILNNPTLCDFCSEGERTCCTCHLNESMSIPILSSATAEDVAGKIVYGNLPMHLAALAAGVLENEYYHAKKR